VARSLLRHSVRNLLENARKHGGGDVAARLGIDGQGTRVLQVSDRGAGIAEAERDRIFEAFYRRSAPPRRATDGAWACRWSSRSPDSIAAAAPACRATVAAAYSS
jgi:K+-sensing histidine kinase KdpD